LLLAIFLSGCGTSPSPSSAADERDQAVLEALLLHLLPNPQFDLTGVGANGATIVLDSRTPGGNRLFKPALMRGPRDIGPGHAIPNDVQTDATRRNGDLPASFSGLKFDAPITLAELPRSTGRGKGDPQWFQHAWPNGRAWVHAWLPGYSTDGAWAVVRGWVGPSAHGALLTAFLAKQGGKWSVDWYYFDPFQ
jgi:hypothetical protein